MLGKFRHRVAEIMSAIERAPEGGVLVHCHAGKDRTGLVCALLLELVGVERETVAADYALSQECLRPDTEDWLANGPGERAERERVVAKFAPKAEVMLEVLKQLHEAYGGVEAYLLEAGVASEDLDRLRSRLLGGAAESRLAG
jgi:protein-tyrosine phosphatase